jgi:hypothetical protein
MNAQEYQFLLDNLHPTTIEEAYRWQYLETLKKVKDPVRFLELKKEEFVQKMAQFGTNPLFNITNQIQLGLIVQLLREIELGMYD